MNFQNRLEWLYALRGKNIKLGLEPTRKLLNRLGLTPLPYPVIHIAGTNGKGSTAFFIHAILRAHNLRSGLYTSPHIFRFNERIRINNKFISDNEIESFLAANQSNIEELKTTFFETATAMAFAWFARQRVEAAVIETGLGGRYDATNVVIPECSVITGIAFDHQEFLGETLTQIAAEKLGIVKAGKPFFTTAQDPELTGIFTRTAKEKNAPLTRVKAADIKFDFRGTRFEWSGKKWEIPLPGKHQADNASLALAAARFFLGKRFNAESAFSALKKASWPGRIEILSHEPPVILDSAHNSAGMKALMRTLDEIRPEYSWVGVMAVMRDKELNRILPELSDFFSKIYCTSFEYYRAMEARALEKKLREANISAGVCRVEDLPRIKKSLPEKTGLVVFGSNYILADSRKALSS
jgi:dihydrofolate synthase/folylpolyglutamate synthase